MNPPTPRAPVAEPHAITQCRARYGVSLSLDELRRIESDISEGRALQCSENKFSKFFIVRLPDGQPAKAVVSKAPQWRIVTFLPMDASFDRGIRQKHRGCKGRKHTAPGFSYRNKYQRDRFRLNQEEIEGE